MNPTVRRFFDYELSKRPAVRDNYLALEHVKSKPFSYGALKGRIQFNPARIVSTSAKTDRISLEKRPCFLCGHNRPADQSALQISKDWELLVNPFPILPYHFTIASTSHIPQNPDFLTGIELADRLDGMVVFFNDDGAGASAPDHLHFQAVPEGFLPLMDLIDNKMPLPFKAYTGVYDSSLTPDIRFMSERPLNMYFRKTPEGIRYAVIPRKAHRPAEFFLDPPHRIMVSPGGIDIAGIFIVPVEEDYNRITDKDVENIYNQVTFK